MWDSSTFLGALTPKFYVALTGTSSLISGLILIFEWWYFRKYGTSFIERVSPAGTGAGAGAGGGADAGAGAGALTGGEAGGPAAAEGAAGAAGAECAVSRNPLALLRGAEYARLWAAARRPPLTFYDMNLSAQDHQAWFSHGAELLALNRMTEVAKTYKRETHDTFVGQSEILMWCLKKTNID
ncbi:hypothetical protein ACJJTC_000385 [Scirpophaga incertulas]